MAGRRGLANEERVALSMATVTADASLVEAPCFVYMIVASLIDTTTTGAVTVADSSASGDADKEPEKFEFKKYDPVVRKHVLFKEAKIK